ncbi:MAG: riboflavin synthase [Candidatus Peregrinibacteria bacterium]
MFTGIIARTGKIIRITKAQLAIEVGAWVKKLKPGGSVAVNGACLTVTEIKGGQFSADVMPETFKKTNLGACHVGTIVNLELPLPKTGCFEGHIVTGHVEGVAKVTKIQKRGNSRLVTFQIPTDLARYVVPKGSIAINGVSLTVVDIKKNDVPVNITPYTWMNTNFQRLKIGDKVNVETDIMAKYLEKLSP